MKYFIIYCLAFWHISLLAQEVPRTLNFTKNDYHAQNQNWSIAQTNDGELFFGNREGLLRFDGITWATFPLPNKQIIRSVATDKQGRIYVGGFAEFGFFQKNNFGNLEYTPLSKNVKYDKVKHEEIWHILVTEQAVYFQTFSTIYKYDFHDITVLSPPDNIMFLHEVNGRLVLPVISKGLYELTATNEFRFIEGSAFLSKKIISTLLPYKNQGILIGTVRDGIYVFENNQFHLWHEAVQGISRNYQLNKGVQLSNGNYAFGTILNGVYLIKPDGTSLFHINKENGLQNNTVLSIHEDRAQNLWLGLDKGIDLIDLTSPLTFFQDRSGRIGSVYAAAVFNGHLFVGTNQGLFYKKDGSNDKFTLLNGTQGQVWDVRVMGEQLLVGHNMGSFTLNNRLELTKISDVTGGWCSIVHPSVKDVFLQGTYTGIAVYQKNKQGQWALLKKINNFGEPVKKIAFDHQGYLWAINAYHQLFKLKINDNLELTEGATPIKIGDAAKYDVSKTESEFYIKADNGYYNFDYSKSVFNKTNNPSLDNIKLYKGIGDDNLKVHTDFVEILRGDKNMARLRLKLIADYETVAILDSSRYLFGLDDGYAIFNRNNNISNASFTAKPIIRLFAKDGATFHFYPTSPYATLLHLSHDYRALRIDFSLPYFTDAARFSYFLTGQSTQWSSWESATSHEFANLSAGKHSFKLRNDITGEETVIEFDIEPHWYETIWAKIGYLLLFIGLIFLLLKFHKYQLSNQRQYLEAEMLRELEQQRIRADNEKLHLDIINKSQELANSTMGIIRKNEILIEIKEELEGIKSEHGLRFPEKHYQKLKQMIENNLSSEENWRVFEENFNGVHEDFLKRLKQEFTDLTPGDLKLAAYLRMNLTSKEISPLLYISVRGVENKRYRLRKKLDLKDSDNLTEFILKY
ncbi:MAG: hypothetical protein JNL70_04915 [Saprospiraceae bacterium]|nr:hypothetical protein [Saprospiraceae bacterium]